MLYKKAPDNYTSGRQLVSGADINTLTSQLYSNQLLTAATTQTQAGAIAGAVINASAVLLTVANAGDVVALPLGYVGLEVLIANPAGQSVTVFGSGIDTINNVATATGVAQAASTNAIYKCVAVVAGVGKWYRVLTA